MRLEIKLDFNHYESCEVNLAITPEQVKLPKHEFIALVSESLGVIHANAQAYAIYAERGSLDPRKPDLELQESR